MNELEPIPASKLLGMGNLKYMFSRSDVGKKIYLIGQPQLARGDYKFISHYENIVDNLFKLKINPSFPTIVIDMSL